MDEQKAKKKGFSVKWIVILALIVLAGVTSFYMVSATEQAVVTRFGKYIKTVGAGPHLKLPFGIDKHYNVPVTVELTKQYGFRTTKAGRNNEYRNNITEESTMLTGDLNLVEVEWTIYYRINDPVKWLFNVKERENTIDDVSRSVISTLIGDRSIQNVLSNARIPISEAGITMMNETFDKIGLGILVTNIQFQNIIAPEGVRDSFIDVTKAMQEMESSINEGKEAYNNEIPKAEGEAKRQEQIAEGYATERINQAKGDVARFNSVYEEYKRSPRVTKERIYLETMEEIFSDETKPTILDSELKNVVPFKDLNEGGKN